MTETTGILTLPGLEHFQTPEGRFLLSEAARFSDPLLAVTVLRRKFPQDLVGMAVEIVDLRRRAAAKFPDADRLFFSREALEQSSGAEIAAYRAQRYAGFEAVADWGCGAGMDSMALAGVTHAIGLDVDALRIALARSNAASLGRENAEFHVADFLARPPDAPAIWADPARRVDGRRVTDPALGIPPLDRIVAHAAGRPLGVKISPAVEAAHIPADAEAEFISVNGELKEAVLWYGDLCTGRRRATILPERVSLVPDDAFVQVAPVGEALFDPDPAVLRAGAVRDLGRMLGAWQTDAKIAYLTGFTPVATPFAQTFVVEASMPWNLKNVKRRLRAHGQRVEEVRKRGSAVDTEAVRKALKTNGETPVVLILTRQENKPWAILATRWKA